MQSYKAQQIITLQVLLYILKYYYIYQNSQHQSIITMTTQNLRSLSPCIIEDKTKDGASNPAYAPVVKLVDAIKDENNKNIAITGNYGSGKSSVIGTALQKLSDTHRCISVSLAMLNTNDEGNKKTGEHVTPHKSEETYNTPKTPSFYENQNILSIDNQIECSILQQILCSAHPEEIPKSKYNRLYKISGATIIKISLVIFLALLFCSILFEPNFIYIKSIADHFTVSQNLKFWIDLLCILGLCVNFCIAAYYLCNKVCLPIKRITIKGTELELGTSSIFNKNIDELIYFFACTETTVVAFEDLDRFKEKSYIFNKLRELNRILNNSKYVNEHCGKITFIYAVKDDLFTDTERVKFFDYIIPIIPVINTYNSYDKLVESLDPSDLTELDNKDLMNLCEYIDDMRMLLNIINEYEQYKKIIDLSVLKKKTLFGLIVYKNYFPTDFSLLYNKEGVLASIINNRKTYAQKQQQEYLEKAGKIDNQISELKAQEQNSLRELRKKYVDIYKKKGTETYSYIDSISNNKYYYTFDKFIESEKAFDVLRNNDNLSYYYSGQNRKYGAVLPFKQIEILVNPDATYEEQQKKLFMDEEIKELTAIKNTQLIYAASVSDNLRSIAKANITSINEELAKLKNQKYINLVKYLILTGFIDEQYINYISFFYPQSLGTAERDFIIQSTSRSTKSHTTRLTKTKALINRFEPSDFLENEYLLNNSLVQEIFANEYFAQYRNAIISNITENNNIDFIRDCYSDKDTIIKDDFYKGFFAKASHTLLGKYLHKENDKYDIILEAYLKYAALNDNSHALQITKFVESNFQYIIDHVDSLTIARTLNILKELNIKFRTINVHKNIPEEIRVYIIANNAYVINANNISSIMKHWSLLSSYNTKALSTIVSVPERQFSQHIIANLGKAITVFPESSVFENDKAISLIINTVIPDRTKKNYIRKQKRMLSTPIYLDSKSINYTYRNSLIEPTWANLAYFMIDKGLGIPHTFLTNNKLLGIEDLSNEKAEKLASKLIASNSLSLVAYKNVVESYGKTVTSINDDLSVERLKVLLEHNTLSLSKSTYEICFNNGLGKELIINNISSYIDNPQDYKIDGKILDAVLSELKTTQKKAEFISEIKEQNVIPRQSSADFINRSIYNGDLEVTDINPIMLEYSISLCGDEGTRLNVAKKALFERAWDTKRVIAVISALAKHNNEYSRLISESKLSRITYSNNNLRIAKFLHDHGMIIHYFIKESNIIIIKK